ncbi:MAG: hypothetical protein FJ041_00145 [Candidatus Cloacimonetes bacterium]|nr:hypothetical protein [Candidatus Cloacimonadota bacterium]
MKLITLILLVCSPIVLIGATRTVSLDGTQQYTSIQTAIDASINGDIVEVYPGEYIEHLNTNGRSITIRSRYYYTHSHVTIVSTIIHSIPQYSCLKVEFQETVTIDGFTLMNNCPLDFNYNFNTLAVAGGIKVSNNSSINIMNCQINNCIGWSAGGIVFEGNNFFMSNTQIYDNFGYYISGGVSIDGDNANSIVFDVINLNSVYNNTSQRAMDISLSNLPDAFHISLMTLSVILTEPDGFFVRYYDNYDTTLSVLYASLNLINQDIYVSPNGNDSNTGLSPQDPLKTIAYAVRVIESDSINPKTIHLLPGVYSFSMSNQYFPLTLKSHTRLIGDAMEGVYLDTGLSKRGFFGFNSKTDIHIENITFMPNNAYEPLVGFGESNNIVLRNLQFNGTFAFDRISFVYVNNVICENIIVTNSTINDLNLAFRTMRCDNIILNNIIIDSLEITGGMANFMGIFSGETDLTIRNSIFSNCYGYDVAVLFYQNIEPASTEYSFDMSNTLIFNNVSYGSILWSGAPVYLSNRYQRMKINNCTIANNNGVNTNVLRIKGDIDINNSIFYNPGNSRDVVFWNVYDGYVHHPSINYSLLNRPFYAVDSTLVSSSNLLINTNPLFMGSVIQPMDISDPHYYCLSDNSPCINAGTPDTLGLGIPLMDLAGNHRIWDGRIDMGCYEYGSSPVSNINPEYPSIPDRIVMSIYPNPVYLSGSKGAYTFIEFTLPTKAKEPPLVEIFNIKGQKVKSIRLTESYNSLVRKAGLSNQVKLSGEFYSTIWNCRDDNNKLLSTGTYIIRLITDGRCSSKKITVIK